jgi:hypothetical protein
LLVPTLFLPVALSLFLSLTHSRVYIQSIQNVDDLASVQIIIIAHKTVPLLSSLSLVDIIRMIWISADELKIPHSTAV